MSNIKLIVEVDEETVKKGFDGPLTDEERQSLLCAFGNAKSVDTSGDGISREALKEAFEIEEWYWGKRVIETIDNAPTLELNSEYGAIQYSNGFNDGFTAAKDTIIQNIAKQYIEHNELVPIWLSIGDIKAAQNE